MVTLAPCSAGKPVVAREVDGDIVFPFGVKLAVDTMLDGKQEGAAKAMLLGLVPLVDRRRGERNEEAQDLIHGDSIMKRMGAKSSSPNTAGKIKKRGGVSTNLKRKLGGKMRMRVGGKR